MRDRVSLSSYSPWLLVALGDDVTLGDRAVRWGGGCHLGVGNPRPSFCGPKTVGSWGSREERGQGGLEEAGENSRCKEQREQRLGRKALRESTLSKTSSVWGHLSG